MLRAGGLDSLPALTFGGSGPPECLGMMTTQFSSADGCDGCDFPINLAVTHMHTHTWRSWGLCFHDSERAWRPFKASPPSEWGSAQAAVKFEQKRDASSKTQACAGGARGLGQEMPEPRWMPGPGGRGLGVAHSDFLISSGGSAQGHAACR